MNNLARNEKENNERWQPKDYNFNLPLEEKVDKKNIILIVIYLTLLIGSLFAI